LGILYGQCLNGCGWVEGGGYEDMVGPVVAGGAGGEEVVGGEVGVGDEVGREDDCAVVEAARLELANGEAGGGGVAGRDPELTPIIEDEVDYLMVGGNDGFGEEEDWLGDPFVELVECPDKIAMLEILDRNGTGGGVNEGAKGKTDRAGGDGGSTRLDGEVALGVDEASDELAFAFGFGDLKSELVSGGGGG